MCHHRFALPMCVLPTTAFSCGSSHAYEQLPACESCISHVFLANLQRSCDAKLYPMRIRINAFMFEMNGVIEDVYNIAMNLFYIGHASICFSQVCMPWSLPSILQCPTPDPPHSA